MIKVGFKKLAFFGLVLYLLFSVYTITTLFVHRSKAEGKDKASQRQALPQEIEVWGKAAVSLYLWQHIFEGTLNSVNGPMLRYGDLTLDNFHFHFQNGPLVTPSSVNQRVKHLILVLNGRSSEKKKFAQVWLGELPRYKELRTVVVVLLGDERCSNQWIYPYLAKNGGLVDRLFVVYDSPDVDARTVFQWPLGVATYRGFEKTDYDSGDAKRRRKYICNFLGTIHVNSSRELLLSILRERKLAAVCYTRPRHKWLTTETKESRESYQRVLEQSDLTLCPVGINSESYRIYEAMSYGSVPVLEDKMTQGLCGKNTDSHNAAPFRLLKEYAAPVIFVKDWTELRGIIEAEKKLRLRDKINRRLKVIHWYRKFKSLQRNRMLRVLRHVMRFKLEHP